MHDPTQENPAYAFALSRIGDDDGRLTTVGVLRDMEQPTYEELVADQMHGRRDGTDLKAAALAAGISLPGLYRAADALGVVREPIEGTSRKLWRLT